MASSQGGEARASAAEAAASTTTSEEAAGEAHAAAHEVNAQFMEATSNGEPQEALDELASDEDEDEDSGEAEPVGLVRVDGVDTHAEVVAETDRAEADRAEAAVATVPPRE